VSIYISILLCVLHSNMCHVWVPDGQGPVVGLAACERMGEIDAANFIKDHENYYVKAIRCTIGSKPHSEDDA
jgi:hypothetical protein